MNACAHITTSHFTVRVQRFGSNCSKLVSNSQIQPTDIAVRCLNHGGLWCVYDVYAADVAATATACR